MPPCTGTPVREEAWSRRACQRVHKSFVLVTPRRGPRGAGRVLSMRVYKTA